MARVSIFYDNEKKEQFFMVRGDERYARSTKTELEFVSTYEEMYSYDCTLTVNVLRDTGDGEIILYDNEVITPVLIYDETEEEWVQTDSIPWNSENNGMTFKVAKLTYDVNHNFIAKYIGNKSCSPSSSNTVIVTKKDTKRPASILTIDDTVQYPKNTTITKTITLSNEVSSSYNEGQDIKVSYDGTLVDTVTTNASGVATVDIPTGDTGLHTITFDYEGYEHLLPSIVTQDISVGYNIEWLNYTNPVVVGTPLSIAVKFYDWFGTPYVPSVSDVEFSAWLDGLEKHYMEWVTTYSDGIFYGQSTGAHLDELRVTLTVDNVTYSESVFPDYAQVLEVAISSDTPRLYRGVESTLTFAVTASGAGVKSGIPINLTGGITGTVYTDSNGVATAKIRGTGVTSKTVTASAGTINESITLQDYITYWSKSSEDIKQGNITFNSGNLLVLNAVFGAYSPSNNDVCVFALPNWFDLEIPRDTSWELKIEGIVSSKEIRIGVGTPYSNTEGPYYIPTNSAETHKYSNGSITFTSNGTTTSVSVYDGSTLIGSRTDAANIANIAFRNFERNSQQATFNKLTFRYGV